MLRHPDPHTGKAYALTGPGALGYDEVATGLSSVAGRVVTYEPVDAKDFEARLLEAGVPGWRAFYLAHITSAFNPSDNVVWPIFLC